VAVRALIVCLPIAVVVGFALGRVSTETASAGGAARVYTLRQGDIARAPAAATRCLASQEGAFRNLFCSRRPHGRYQVVFYADAIQVWRSGNPNGPVFSARWAP
jgi:hypothetical protein